jgi:hypothetical protein
MTTTEWGLAAKSAAILSTITVMKALVYHGPGKRTWEDKTQPTFRGPATPSLGSPREDGAPKRREFLTPISPSQASRFDTARVTYVT